MTNADTAYPYLLINAYDETTLRYVNKDSARFIKSVIIDSGVHSVFHRLELNEYPGGYVNWIAKVASLWRTVSRHVEESYAVIPDYPADYDNNPIHDNVERTFRNIEYATRHYPNVKWIIPLQGKKDDVASVVKSFEYVRDMGLLGRYGYVAIAPTCTTHSLRFLRDVAQIVWKRVKQLEKSGQYVKIHMFGVTVKAWRDIAHYVDSTDAIIGNIWCKPLIGKMCTTRTEKEMGWRMFLERVAQVYTIRRL
jgi:hypothetical protein